MRFDRLITRHIRRDQGGVRLDMDVNAHIAANIDRQAVPAAEDHPAKQAGTSPGAAGNEKGGKE